MSLGVASGFPLTCLITSSTNQPLLHKTLTQPPRIHQIVSKQNFRTILSFFVTLLTIIFHFVTKCDLSVFQENKFSSIYSNYCTTPDTPPLASLTCTAQSLCVINKRFKQDSVYSHCLHSSLLPFSLTGLYQFNPCV